MKAKSPVVVKPKLVLTAHNVSSKTSKEDHWNIHDGTAFIGHATRLVSSREISHPYKVFVGVGDKAIQIGSLTGGFRRVINCLTEALS